MNTRILKQLLSFAEFQLDREKISLIYRGTRNVECIHLDVDFNILHNINSRLFSLSQDNSHRGNIVDELAFSYLEQSVNLLNPWLIHFDSNIGSRSDTFSKISIDKLLEKIIITEQKMAVVTTSKWKFDAAEGHCQRSLTYSRRIRVEKERKTTLLFDALGYYIDLREKQFNLLDAVIFAEECYNLVVEVYDCVHPTVQVAAGKLISILSRKGDFHDALRFAEVTYGNLRDKKNGMDQMGGEMATGAYNLADVIYRQRGDLIKAEELARESLRIRTLINHSDHNTVGVSSLLLAHILRVQGKLGNETFEVFERTLNIFFIDEGPDGINTAIGNMSIAQFHENLAGVQASVDSKRIQLQLSKSYYEEAFRIVSKVYGPTHQQTFDTAYRWDLVTKQLSSI
jgi:tetratricopeptide (TPR) repeat protein